MDANADQSSVADQIRERAKRGGVALSQPRHRRDDSKLERSVPLVGRLRNSFRVVDRGSRSPRTLLVAANL